MPARRQPDDEGTPMSFTTATGVRLDAESWGRMGDPAVVLVHGGGQTRHSWGGTARELAAAGWWAVAYDQRGHGTSDRAPDRDYGKDAFAADLVDVVAQVTSMSAAPPVVVGASLGGLAALLAEGQIAPGSCAALVLVDITPRMEPDGVRRIVGFMMDRMEDGYASLEEAAAAIARYQPHRPPPEDLRGLSKNLRRDPDGRWRWHWDPDFFLGPRPVGSGQDTDSFHRAARALRVPTMLVRGRLSDLVSPETAAEFLELCPHAVYVDVNEAGHMVAGDRNDVFTSAVAGFLAELPGREGPHC